MLTADRKRLKERRRRLSDISWFMRCLAENIARRSNREDDTTGRFWSGRFKMPRLLDESALLACSVYVDLNPIRAGVAKTPETSRYTSAYDRIRSRKPSRSKKKTRRGKRRVRQVTADAWLSPIELNEREPNPDGRPRQRASNRGFLPMGLDDYLRLLDWTGRQVRREKQGSIPADLAPILERLKIVPGIWSAMVQQFGRWFGTAAGSNDALAAEAPPAAGAGGCKARRGVVRRLPETPRADFYTCLAHSVEVLPRS
jgi:hypothetical protein